MTQEVLILLLHQVKAVAAHAHIDCLVAGHDMDWGIKHGCGACRGLDAADRLLAHFAPKPPKGRRQT